MKSEVKSTMKTLKKIGLILLVIILFGVAYLVNAVVRYDLRFNGIVEEILFSQHSVEWGERIELIPEQFLMIDEREAVIQKLNMAGFNRVPDEQVWARYDYEIEQGRELYTREANNLFCAIVVYVFVGFDDGGELIFAEGTVHEHGCL